MKLIWKNLLKNYIVISYQINPNPYSNPNPYPDPYLKIIRTRLIGIFYWFVHLEFVLLGWHRYIDHTHARAHTHARTLTERERERERETLVRTFLYRLCYTDLLYEACCTELSRDAGWSAPKNYYRIIMLTGINKVDHVTLRLFPSIFRSMHWVKHILKYQRELVKVDNVDLPSLTSFNRVLLTS